MASVTEVITAGPEEKGQVLNVNFPVNEDEVGIYKNNLVDKNDISIT